MNRLGAARQGGEHENELDLAAVQRFEETGVVHDEGIILPLVVPAAKPDTVGQLTLGALETGRRRVIAAVRVVALFPIRLQRGVARFSKCKQVDVAGTTTR